MLHLLGCCFISSFTSKTLLRFSLIVTWNVEYTHMCLFIFLPGVSQILSGEADNIYILLALLIWHDMKLSIAKSSTLPFVFVFGARAGHFNTLLQLQASATDPPRIKWEAEAPAQSSLAACSLLLAFSVQPLTFSYFLFFIFLLLAVKPSFAESMVCFLTDILSLRYIWADNR